MLWVWFSSGSGYGLVQAVVCSGYGLVQAVAGV